MTDYYSGIAEGYDELYGEEQDAKLRSLLDRVVLLPGSTLLDVGCGTGRSAKMLRQVKWQGIDPAEGLVRQAPDEVRQKIIIGKAESLPFPDNMFDVVLSLTAIQNFTDAEQGIREMARVCKPKGILLISFLKKSPNAEKLHAFVRQLTVKETWEDAKDHFFICTA